MQNQKSNTVQASVNENRYLFFGTGHCMNYEGASVENSTVMPTMQILWFLFP
jgi:hypothetical protein